MLPKLEEVCRFYIARSCRRGADCDYSHDLKKVLCKYYHLQGYCADGDECDFSHEEITFEQYQELQRKEEAAQKARKARMSEAKKGERARARRRSAVERSQAVASGKAASSHSGRAGGGGGARGNAERSSEGVVRAGNEEGDVVRNKASSEPWHGDIATDGDNIGADATHASDKPAQEVHSEPSFLADWMEDAPPAPQSSTQPPSLHSGSMFPFFNARAEEGKPA